MEVIIGVMTFTIYYNLQLLNTINLLFNSVEYSRFNQHIIIADQNEL